jgi:predicted nucleic acid-binding Zn ribbon protein
VPCSQDLIPIAVANFLQNICGEINEKERERMGRTVINKFKMFPLGLIMDQQMSWLSRPGISHDKYIKCTHFIPWILR